MHNTNQKKALYQEWELNPTISAVLRLRIITNANGHPQHYVLILDLFHLSSKSKDQYAQHHAKESAPHLLLALILILVQSRNGNGSHASGVDTTWLPQQSACVFRGKLLQQRTTIDVASYDELCLCQLRQVVLVMYKS